ncbi:MAG: DUF721 domain-containing protein [Polyangiales bacterium]
MRRRRSFPVPMNQVLRGVYPAKDDFDSVRVFSWWMRAVPERVVQNARPVSLKNGQLRVHVSSSVWAQELHYMSPELLKQITAAAPEARVKSLRFVVGELPELPPPSPYFSKKTESRVPRPDELPEELGRALASIHDDELRDRIACAAVAGKHSDRPR